MRLSNCRSKVLKRPLPHFLIPTKNHKNKCNIKSIDSGRDDTNKLCS